MAEAKPVDDEQDEAERESKRARPDEELIMVWSVDGEVISWSKEGALRAGALNRWIHLYDTNAERGAYPTPIPADALWTLKEACEHVGDEATSPIASLPIDKVFALLDAANFLEALGRRHKRWRCFADHRKHFRRWHRRLVVPS